MAFTIPLSVIRGHIADAIDAGLSVTSSENATYYPDASISQEAIDKATLVDAAADYYGCFFVIIPEVIAGERTGSCGKYNDVVVPVELTICRRQNDLPHRKATTMLDDAAAVMTRIAAIATPWSSTAYVKDVYFTQMATRFAEAEALNAAHYSCVRLSFNLIMELS